MKKTDYILNSNLQIAKYKSARSHIDEAVLLLEEALQKYKEYCASFKDSSKKL